MIQALKKFWTLSLAVTFLVTSLISSLQAAAFFTIDPPANVSLAAKAESDGPASRISFYDLPIGNFTQGTTISDVTFTISKDGSQVYSRALAGGSFSNDRLAGNLNSIGVDYVAASQKIEIFIDLNLQGGSFDLNGHLPGDYVFRLKGLQSTGGGPGNGSSSGINSGGGGGTQQVVTWDTANSSLVEGWGALDIQIVDNLPSSFPPAPSNVDIVCETGAGQVDYSEEHDSGSGFQVVHSSSLNCIGGFASVAWQSTIGAGVQNIRVLANQSSFGLSFGDQETIGQGNTAPQLAGDFSAQMIDTTPSGIMVSVDDVLSSANATASDAESGDLTADIFLREGSSVYQRGESFSVNGVFDVTFQVVVSDGMLEDVENLRVIGNARPVIVVVSPSVTQASGSTASVSDLLSAAGVAAADAEDGSYTFSDLTITDSSGSVLNLADIISFTPGFVESLRLNVSDSNSYAAEEKTINLSADNAAPTLGGDYSDQVFDIPNHPESVSVSVASILDAGLITALDPEDGPLTDQVFLRDTATLEAFLRADNLTMNGAFDTTFEVVVQDSGGLEVTRNLRILGNARPVLSATNTALSRSSGTDHSVANLLGAAGAILSASDLEDGVYALAELSIISDTFGVVNPSTIISFTPSFTDTLIINKTDSDGYPALSLSIVLSADNTAPSLTLGDSSDRSYNHPEYTSLSVDQILTDINATATDPEDGILTDQVFLRDGPTVYQQGESFNIDGSFNTNFDVVVQDSSGLESSASIRILGNAQPVLTNPTAQISHLEGTTKTLLDLLTEAGVSISDAEETISLSSVQFFENGVEYLNPTVNFAPGLNLTFELRVSDSQGNTGVADQTLTLLSQESLELSVENMAPGDESEGISRNPILYWDLLQNGNPIANIVLTQDPYSFDLDTLQFAIKHKTVADQFVDPIECASSSTISFSGGLPREKEITDVSLNGDQWVIWCVALVEVDGPSITFLTDFSNASFFKVRSDEIQVPNLVALPESSLEQPTGNPFVTLRASGGEASPSVARFYREQDGELIAIGDQAYDAELQAQTIFEIPDLTQEGVYRFAVATVRDGLVVGPTSSLVTVHYNADQLISPPVLEEENPGVVDGNLLIKNVPSDDSLAIELWRRNGTTDTCDPATEECWLDAPTFRKIASFTRIEIPGLDHISLISGDGGDIVRFEDREALDLSHGKGVSYFAQFKGGDNASLRSNSISKADESPLNYEIGNLKLVADQSGFEADIYIDGIFGYPENSADWIVQVQKASLQDSSIRCSTIDFDSLAPSEPTRFDSLTKINDASKGLQSAVKAATVQAIPNEKTCVLVCISDISNSSIDGDEGWCYDGDLITEDNQPVAFNGLTNLIPDETGTSATAIAPALEDDPSEQVAFIERKLFYTTRFIDGVPDFSEANNPIIVDDPEQMTVSIPGLPTGVEVAAYMEAIDSGGNISGDLTVLSTSLPDNTPRIFEASLSHIKNAPPYQLELRALVGDRNLVNGSNEEIRIVDFAILPSSGASGDSLSFNSVALESALMGRQALDNILFSPPSLSGALNRLSASSSQEQAELRVGIDVSALIQPEDLQSLDFMIVVEDSEGLRSSYLTTQGTGSQFDTGTDAGARLAAGGCSVSASTSWSFAQFFTLLMIVFAFVVGRSRRQEAQ